MRSYIIKMGGMISSYAFRLIGPVHTYYAYGIKTTTTETMVAVGGVIAYFGMECFLCLFENVASIAPKLVKTDLNTAIQLWVDKTISEAEFRWLV